MADQREDIHVISALVENEFGVLARIAALFAARSFNIESLTVGPTHDHSMSRMTIMVKGDATILEQVKKQLNKLIEVIAVADLATNGKFLNRELMLLKVHCNPENRVELLQIGDLFKAEAVDYTPGSLTFQIIGSPEKLENFLTFMEPYEISEVVRSGAVALNRGSGGMQTEFLEQQEARGKAREKAPA